MPDKAKEAAQVVDARWYKTLGSRVWSALNSLKLTIFILVSIALTAIIGTVVEQNSPVEEYLAQYGETWTRVILYARFNDMYHAWWFMSLLSLMSISIIVCTMERFPPKWKSLLNHKVEKFDPKLIEKFAHHETLRIKESPEALKEKLLGVLRKKKFGVVSSGGGKEYYIYAWKGRHGRLGSDAIHISLLVILFGSIVGSYAGYKDFFAVNEGGTISVPQADFNLRLDKFWIDYYDSGQIRQFNSNLAVMEDGKEVLKKQIWVNEPLYYKGIRFYQSSYGQSWNKVSEAEIALRNKDKGKPEAPFTVKWDAVQKVPGSKYSVKLVGYTADFAYDERTSTVFSKSPEANNPAVMVEVYDDGDRLVSTPWLFMKYPGIFPAIPDSSQDLVYLAHRPIMYSGISVNKDPGTNIVWLGSIIMGLGFILAFFIYHRRIWIYLKDTGQSTEVRIGGTINKNQLVFEKDIKEITSALSTDASRGNK